MQIYLETDRLTLRRFTSADEDNLVELDGDPEVMRHLTGGRATPREVIARDILPTFLHSYERFAGFGVWAAIEKESKDFTGWFAFRPSEGSGPEDVELGYRLRRTVWGQGYATEGARALIRKGFTELGVQRVAASTYEHNRASRRVMEKAGLRFVRAFHPTIEDLMAGDTNDHTSQEIWDGDEVEYELRRADWEEQEAAICRD